MKCLSRARGFSRSARSRFLPRFESLVAHGEEIRGVSWKSVSIEKKVRIQTGVLPFSQNSILNPVRSGMMPGIVWQVGQENTSGSQQPQVQRYHLEV